MICKPLNLCVNQDWQARREVLVQEVDLANNLTTTYDYDIFGRLRFAHRPDGTQTEYDYWDVGTAVDQQFIYISVPDDTGDGLTQQVYLDGFAREWKVVKEGGARQLTTYHENSERIATRTRWHLTSESGNPTSFVYDGAKRLFEVDEPGRTLPIHKNYELLANPALASSVLKPVVREDDHLGELKHTWLDAYGRVSAVREHVDGGSHDTTFSYDTLDNLDIVKDALTNTADYDFDSLGRKTHSATSISAAGASPTDANGNPIGQEDARGVVTASSFDALDRITGRTNADGVSTWVYDEVGHGFSKGKLTSTSYPGGTESYNWDNMGFQSGSTRCVEGNCKPLTQVFTKSRLDTLTYPDGEVVNYDYDNAGHVSSVVSSTAGNLAGPITWNARDQIELASYGNGVTSDPGYHASFDVLGSISVTGTSGAIQQATYVYDQAARVDSMTSSTHPEASLDFGYDALDRLKTVAPLGAATQSQSFTYNAIGNVLTNSQIGGGTFQYTSGKPHAIARAGSRYYGYDANGNTTSVTTQTPDCVTIERLMNWDATNRLRWVSAGNQTTSYRYDAGGQRIAKSGPGGTTHYFGTHIEVEDPDGAKRLVKYYYLGDALLARSESGTRLWYHLDHVGSVRAMSAQDGTRSVAYEYAAFGDTIGTIGAADNLRGFGSHWRDDESHLVYMSARYQDPVIGRFTQPDTIVPEPGDPQSWNRYSYVRNNPVNRIDPTGHQDLPVIGGGEFKRAIEKVLRTAEEAQKKIGEVEDQIVDTAIDTVVDRVGPQLYRDPNGFVEKALEAARDENVRGAISEAVKQVPENWEARETDSPGGVEFVDPENEHNRIRVMPGNPDSRWESQRNPYVKDQRHGQTRDANGKVVPNKSAESHIPGRDFRYRD